MTDLYLSHMSPLGQFSDSSARGIRCKAAVLSYSMIAIASIPFNDSRVPFVAVVNDIFCNDGFGRYMLQRFPSQAVSDNSKLLFN
jgi:hypothetical protein